MDHFDSTFLIDNSDSPVKAIRVKIYAWVTSPWLTDLVALWGGRISLESSLDELLAYLDAFSDRWDFRRIAREQGASTDDQLRQGQGSARWLSASTGSSPEMEARILDNAGHLGLVRSLPPTRNYYDHILVLGGARLSCLLRPTLAAQLLRSGLRVGSIGLLGAARPIPDSERDATDTYAPRASTEFDLIVAGAQNAFGIDVSAYREERYNSADNGNLSWVIQRFTTLFEARPLVAVSAPSSDPLRRRANSADTILFFLDHNPLPANGALLLVTSQIYVPYVQIEALRTVALARNLTIETIGVPADRMPALQGLSNANHYLQEIRSAIQAAWRFCQAYPDPI